MEKFNNSVIKEKSMFMVSVISPFHNTDLKVFERSFKSVMKQSIGFENIEYVIVIHNSDENHRKGVEKIAEGYDNVKLFILNNDKNTPGSPRNYGLHHVTGQYIAFLDSDDIFYPDALESALNAITQENAQICTFRFDNSIGDNVVVVHQYSLFDQTNEKIVLKKGEYDQRKLITGMNLTVTSKLYEGRFLRDNKLFFDETVSFAEDGLFNLTCLAYAEKIIILPQLIGYQYYQNDGSAMQTFKRKENDLWQLCLCVEKMAETAWRYGLYIDAYVVEVAASTGAYILCSDVRYPFLKKVSKIIVPILDTVKPLSITKIDSKESLRTFKLVSSLVYRHPLITAFLKFVIRVLHIDLEKIIKESKYRVPHTAILFITATQVLPSSNIKSTLRLILSSSSVLFLVRPITSTFISPRGESGTLNEDSGLPVCLKTSMARDIRYPSLGLILAAETGSTEERYPWASASPASAIYEATLFLISASALGAPERPKRKCLK